MAEPSIDDVGKWILDNQDKAGSPDYVTMSDTYRQMNDAQQPQDITGVMHAKNAANPYGLDATMNRMFTGAVTGIPDLAIGGYNAAARAVGKPGAQADYLGPKMLAAGGGVPLPEDAGTGRQLLEGGGSALIGGGVHGIADAVSAAPSVAGAIVPALRALVTRVIAPTVGSHAGGTVGGATASALGLDPETGSLLGSLAGGTGATVLPSVPRQVIAARYANRGNANAPAIAAAAERQNVPLTAGMVGNDAIQARERAYGGASATSNAVSAARTASTTGVADALDRAAVARGSLDTEPTPGSVGQGVQTIAGDTAESLRARAAEGQQRLLDRVGARTQVPVQPIFNEGYRQMPDMAVPARSAIDYRLTDQLAPLVARDVTGQAALDASGSPTVPYGLLKQWRTDLGRSFDQGRFPPATTQLYGPATAAMRGAAERAGVPPQNFENVQGRTRQVEQRGGDYANLTDIAGKEPSAAFNYLKGGEQNPERLGMIEATQHPQVGNVMGDYLRMIGNQTIGQQGARGPINLANRIEGMHPDARSAIAGPQEPAVNDISTLARSLDYPTSKTGLGKALGSSGENLGSKLIMSEILGRLGEKTGIPLAGEAGRYLGLKADRVTGGIGNRIMQSPTAINAMAGRPRPGVPYGMADLVAAINAASASQTQQRGP